MHRIYELNMVQQIHPSEISRQLDISEHTVKKHLANIRKRLRDAVISLLFSLLLFAGCFGSRSSNVTKTLIHA